MKWRKINPANPLNIGDRVCHNEEVQGCPDGSRKVRGSREYGVVVQTWDDDGWQNCYVAFHGFKQHFESKKEPKHKPYILRYHYTSLEKL